MVVKKRRNRGKETATSSAPITVASTTAEAIPVAAAAQPLSPQEAARIIKAAPVDPSTQIVRHMALFRIIIFLLLIHTYVRYLPLTELHGTVVDAWFTYDQFEFFFNWAPLAGDPWGRFKSMTILTCAVFCGMLTVMGGINGIQHSLRVSGTIFLSCFAFRFFTFAYNFTDRHYLLFLLGVISLVSGGGGFFLIFTEVDSEMTEAQQENQRQKRRRLIQNSEWGAVTLRFQYAVVFLFSSLWKLHADYLQGHVLRCHLIGFDDEPNHESGLLWPAMEALFGRKLFQFLGIGWFLVDFGMFVTLTFRRPTDDNVRPFVVWTLIFHLFVALTMGHKLGYSFSIVCMAAILIFHPIGGGSKLANEINSTTSNAQTVIKKRIRNRHQNSEEANLLQWVQRYVTGSPEARASRPQQLFSIAWLVVQLALPLRMPFISGGNYPITAQGYRFSWTMMMHTRQTSVLHVGKYSSSLTAGAPVLEKTVPIHFFYFAPECAKKKLQRKDYMPERAVATEDPRTLPMMSVLTEQQYSFITEYPRYITRVGGGMALILYQMQLEQCQGTHVSVSAIHFAKLNGKGAFCRIFDPTVKLELSTITRYTYLRTWWYKLYMLLLDKFPPISEVLLSSGVGSMNPSIEKYRADVEKRFQGAQRIEFVADRSSCLFTHPLALWPNGFPLAVMALEAPRNTRLYMSSRKVNESASSNLTITAGNQWDILQDPVTIALSLKQPNPVTAVSVEIGIQYDEAYGTDLPPRCALTMEEDVLFALVFMS